MSALNFFFVNNADDDVIQDFLWMDSCAIISDKVNVKTPLQCASWRKEMMMLLSFDYFFFFLQYLLAMVYAYFRRAELGRREYNRMNFFIAL